jgi:hypothetical protein
LWKGYSVSGVASVAPVAGVASVASVAGVACVSLSPTRHLRHANHISCVIFAGVNKFIILKKQSTAASKTNTPNLTLIDKQFADYNAIYHTANKRVILLISACLLLLGLMGILWAAPFPQIKFLGQYAAYINWASFFIALIGFFYYRLSPVICYLVILLLFAFSYIITSLQNWEHAGGFSLRLISTLLIGAGLLMAILINKRMLGKVTVWKAFYYWLLTPAWFLSLVLKGFMKKSN